MAGFTIRPATEADGRALGELGASLLREHYAFDPLRFMAPGANPERGYGHFLVSQLGDSDSLVLVAERDAEVLGYLYGGLEGRSWRDLREPCGVIDDVVVREKERRSGVATALIEAACVWFRERGVPRVILFTAEPNDGAQRLFARLGFRRTMIEMTRELDR